MERLFKYQNSIFFPTLLHFSGMKYLSFWILSAWKRDLYRVELSPLSRPYCQGIVRDKLFPSLFLSRNACVESQSGYVQAKYISTVDTNTRHARGRNDVTWLDVFSHVISIIHYACGFAHCASFSPVLSVKKGIESFIETCTLLNPIVYNIACVIVISW